MQPLDEYCIIVYTIVYQRPKRARFLLGYLAGLVCR
jgi:hypothetical protein